MMSSHFMMVLLVVVGYATTLAVIIIAVVESHRMDKSKRSLLDCKAPRQDEQR
jgi:hypothetical protein